MSRYGIGVGDGIGVGVGVGAGVGVVTGVGGFVGRGFGDGHGCVGRPEFVDATAFVSDSGVGLGSGVATYGAVVVGRVLTPLLHPLVTIAKTDSAAKARRLKRLVVMG